MTSDSWTPPNPPNCQRILHTAVDDTRQGLYERALEKFLWFHSNALKHDDGLGGVRLSFALAYWLDLASKYGPALDAFVRTRDETEAAFLQDPSKFDLFDDLAAMNRDLNDGMRTANLFEMIAAADHDNAKRLYRIAERFLVAAGRYLACDPFLDPQHRLESAARGFQIMKRFEESRPVHAKAVGASARLHYLENVATLIALLVINGRADEAQQAYKNVLDVVSDEESRKIMDNAMTGHLPDRLGTA